MPRSALSPRKQPSQSRSGATVDAIIEGAIRIIVRDGYAQLTTIRVAEQAGVSVGSLYQYFPNKQAIIAEIVRRRTAEIVNAIGDVDVSTSPSPAAAVHELIGILLAEKQRGIALARALEPVLAEVEGRGLIRTASQAMIPALADKLANPLGRPLTEQEIANLGFAVAAVDGAVWEVIASDPSALCSPALRRQLSIILLSALET